MANMMHAKMMQDFLKAPPACVCGMRPPKKSENSLKIPLTTPNGAVQCHERSLEKELYQ